MKHKLNKLNKGTVLRLVVSLTVGLGLSLAWASCAQADGNVQVSIVGGNMVIRGDDHDNNITVTEVGVAGRARTTINGVPDLFFVGGPINAIDIKMNGGNDFVRLDVLGTTLNSPFTGDLKIDSGKGNDIIELLQVQVSAKTGIATGDGNDIVFIDGVHQNFPDEFIKSDFKGDFKVATGAGEDRVEFNGARFEGAVAVNLGSGNDALCPNVGSVYDMPGLVGFNGGSGRDFFALFSNLSNFTGFEGEDDDCSFRGGRF
jgi:hypothetical protein